MQFVVFVMQQRHINLRLRRVNLILKIRDDCLDKKMFRRRRTKSVESRDRDVLGTRLLVVLEYVEMTYDHLYIITPSTRKQISQDGL